MNELCQHCGYVVPACSRVWEFMVKLRCLIHRAKLGTARSVKKLVCGLFISEAGQPLNFVLERRLQS